MRYHRQRRRNNIPGVNPLTLLGAVFALVVVLFIRFVVMGNPKVEKSLSVFLGAPSARAGAVTIQPQRHVARSQKGRIVPPRGAHREVRHPAAPLPRMRLSPAAARTLAPTPTPKPTPVQVRAPMQLRPMPPVRSVAPSAPSTARP